MEPRETESSPKKDSEFSKYNILLLSDPHFHEKEEGKKFKDQYENWDIEEDLEIIENLRDDYECDELLLAGDIGRSKHLDSILNLPFETMRIVEGNHDSWRNSKGYKIFEHDGREVQFGHKLRWDLEIGENNYNFLMIHKPEECGLRPLRKSLEDRIFKKYLYQNGEKQDIDVLVYGHSHSPYFRPLNNGSKNDLLGLGAGSTFINNNMGEGLPDRSVQVLEVNSSILIKHIDWDYDKMIEEMEFERKNGKFRCKYHKKDWKGPRFNV